MLVMDKELLPQENLIALQLIHEDIVENICQVREMYNQLESVSDGDTLAQLVEEYDEQAASEDRSLSEGEAEEQGQQGHKQEILEKVKNEMTLPTKISPAIPVEVKSTARRSTDTPLFWLVQVECIEHKVLILRFYLDIHTELKYG
jgi:hypothetical protein